MSTRVYGWDQNPAVDFRKFKCSNSSADDMLASGRAQEVEDGKSGRAVQQFYQAPRESALSTFERLAQESGLLPPVEVRGVYFVPPKPMPWQMPEGIPAA